MIGAIALTPVLSTSVTAEAASLSTKENAAIEKFVVNFNELSRDRQELVRIVMEQLAKEPNQAIEEPYLDTVGAPYKQLLTFSSVSEVTAVNIKAKYSTFKDAVQSSKGDVTSEELVTYFENVVTQVTEVVKDLNSSDFNNLAGAGLYDEFVNIYEGSQIPASLKPIIKRPSTSIIPAIQEAFNKYLNPGNPGGGGGVIIPPTTGDNAVVVDSSTVESNPQAIINSIKNAAQVDQLVITVPAGDTDVKVPATIVKALEEKNGKAAIVVQIDDVSYEFPVNAFDLVAAAKGLDVASSELEILISIEKVNNPLQDKISYKVLADAFDFEVKLVAPGNKSVVLSVFPTPIKRTIPATSTLNPMTTVGVTVDAKGKVTAVPTYVAKDNKSANLYRSTNSVYTLIEYSKSFTDISGGTSWAEEYVDKLASRMVINGKTENTFAPTLKITRGEFAAILSRGLGIVAMDASSSTFKDVSASQAFNKSGEIAAVVEAGIVSGYTDGTFRPYEEITRDQAAIMISRAIDYVGADKVTFDKKKALTAFKDSKQIGAASRNHVERVYQAGLLDGYQDDTFRPNADANRAQMAKIIYNFLAEIEFIN